MTKDLTKDSYKIAFVWYFSKASIILPKWRDGLRAAMEIIAKEHQVDWFLGEECQYVEDDYDFLLFWSDSSDELIKKYVNYKGKKGLCLTTDPHNIDNLHNYDVVYCESDIVYDQVRRQSIRAIKAFGTDTDFFKPDDVEKDIEYFYPATFSPWKRQSSIAHLGDKLLCVGSIQPDGIQEVAECRKNGVRIEEGYFPVKKILQYYQRSKNVLIPAIHGSERTVLEALSCGIKPEVNPENIKAYSYIKELEESGLEPRDFVIKNYSAQKYAKDILRGIL